MRDEHGHQDFATMEKKIPGTFPCWQIIAGRFSGMPLLGILLYITLIKTYRKYNL